MARLDLAGDEPPRYGGRAQPPVDMRLRLVVLLAMLALGCGPAAAPSPGAGGDPAQRAESRLSVAQRPITIAFSAEVDLLEPSMNAGTGNRDYDALLNSFLAYLNPEQKPMPFLAEELPSLETGTWKVLPDGRMETTYKLRKHPTWHDGRPITAQDFVFTHRVRTDPALAMRPIVEARIGRAEAVDDQTLFLEWKVPYIWAGMVSGEYFAPLPRHLLEDLYTTDKVAFNNGSHWRTEYVGSGPYKLERWEPGVEMVLRAHEGFALGKPAVEQLTIRFIADANTIVANLLSGGADVAFHSSIGFSQNQALEQAGWAGTVEYWRGNPRYLEFQVRDWGNQQKAVLDLRVRRAMLHAIDRQAIVDGLYAGNARLVSAWLDPNDPAYPAVDRAVSKYEYDPGRAESLLGQAGWTKGADGVARTGAGEALHMPMLNQSGEIDQLEAAVVTNYWRSVGITSEIRRLSFSQQGDGEFRGTFPAVSYNRITIDYEAFPWLTRKIATPENRWVGTNRIGYSNPVVDEHYTKAIGTIQDREREPLLVEALKAMTADAVVTVTHLQPRAVAYRRGILGPKETWVGESALIWNAWEWRWTAI